MQPVYQQFDLNLVSFSLYLCCLTREQQNQADRKEVRVLSQTGRIHAEVGFTEYLYVSSY